MDHTYSQTLTLRRILLVIATGVGAGFLSGLFGVGGGLVIVPALMVVLGMDQRRASPSARASTPCTARSPGRVARSSSSARSRVPKSAYGSCAASLRPPCPGSSSASHSS